MTEEQKIVLHKAILNAQTIIDPTIGMDEGDEKVAATSKWKALQNAIEDAQGILTNGASYVEAQDALDALNVQIAGYDESLQATEHNTITFTVPEEVGPFAVPYILEESAEMWMAEMTTGDYTVVAKIVTNTGVLYECSKEIQVYDKANGIKTDAAENVTTSVNDEANPLFTKVEFVYGTEGAPFEPSNEETIKSTTISTSDNDTLEWMSDYSFKAKKAGTVTVYVTVKTDQGNTYTTNFTVEVK